jgi:FtsH-binding integral membrane protein
MQVLTREQEHRFFHAVAWLLAGLVFLGFARTYYLKSLFGAPALPVLLHAHGIVMTLWFGLFIVQVALVNSRRVDLHRRLGSAGLLLGAFAVILSAVVSFGLARQELLTHPASRLPALLLGLQLFAVLGVFVILMVLGYRYRRRPDVHKRLMTMGMLCVLGPALTRLPFLPNHNIGVTIAFNVGLILVVVLADAFLHRRLHPAFAGGAALVIGSMFAIAQLAQTDFWVAWVRRTLL